MATNNEAPPAYNAVNPGAYGAAPQPPPPGFVAGGAAPYPQPYAPVGASKAQYSSAYATTYSSPVGPPPNNTPTTVIVPQTQQNVVVLRGGNCPRCLSGVIVEDFTCCGIFLAIFFFPLGLLCCLLMRQRYCNRCHYTM